MDSSRVVTKIRVLGVSMGFSPKVSLLLRIDYLKLALGIKMIKWISDSSVI